MGNKKREKMKKIAMVLMVVVTLFWLFSSTEKPKKKEPVKEVLKVNKVLELPIPKIVKKDVNNTVTHKKPSVYIYGFSIASVGEMLTLKSGSDEGNISCYLWKKGLKTLGTEPELSVLLSTEGEHTFTLYATDEFGGKAEANLTIDVYPEADKKEYYQHSGCSCQSKSYTYYNSDGNISKVISEGDRNGVTIEEYKYDEEGNLVWENTKNYYRKEDGISSNLTRTYDEFGNELEYVRETRDDDASIESKKMISVYRKKIYDEEHKLLKEVDENNELIRSRDSDVKSYDEEGNLKNRTVEHFYDENSKVKNVEFTEYDSNGNELKSVEMRIDPEGNSTVNSLTEMEYDENNNLLSRKIDNDGDGEVDSDSRYEYDAENRVKRSHDTVRDETIYYDYDANGNEINKKVESPQTNSQILHTYNDKNQQILVKEDSDGDGEFEEITVKKYNAEGKEIFSQTKKDGVVSNYVIHNEQLIEYGGASGFKKRYILNENKEILKEEINRYGNIYTIDYSYNDGEIIRKVDSDGKVLFSVEFKD